MTNQQPVARITGAYYASGGIRILSETSALVGYIDTRDLADLFLKTMQQSVIDMHVAEALKDSSCPCICHDLRGGPSHPGTKCRCNGGEGMDA